MNLLRLYLSSLFILVAVFSLSSQEETLQQEVQDSIAVTDDTALALNLTHQILDPAGDTLMHSGIVTAISAADAGQLAQFFDVAINLSIPDSEGTFSKKQATQLLKFFFDRNPVKEFVLEIEEKTDEDSSYLIGYYRTTEGKNYRTFILIKKLTETGLIRQIQFEEK